MTLNVTALTRARLESVWDHAEASKCLAIALQETRHEPGGLSWASALGGRRGWRMQWSTATERDAQGRRRQGGTLLMWRAELGKGTPFKPRGATPQQHRTTGRRWGAISIVAAYGPARQTDPLWLRDVLDHSAEQGTAYEGRPTIVLGDFNWGPAYDQELGPPGQAPSARRRSSTRPQHRPERWQRTRSSPMWRRHRWPASSTMWQ